MAVMNVTPDSFSDGGSHLDPDAAIRAGLAMAEAGADIIDVGGESTRPGAQPTSAVEEQGRVLPGDPRTGCGRAARFDRHPPRHHDGGCAGCRGGDRQRRDGACRMIRRLLA